MIYIIFSFIFGSCFGSLATLISYRLPLKEDIFFKPSYCDKCKKKIGFFSLFPIISYICQKGKCSNCKTKISIRYPLIEFLTACLFTISYCKFGYSINTIIVDFIITACVIMIVTDLAQYIILDSIQITLLVLNCFYLFINQIDYKYALISSIVYLVTILILKTTVEMFKKKPALGWGDVKLIAIIGLSIGIENIQQFLFLSGLIGIIFSLIWTKITKKKYFPFGPSLILSYLIIMFSK